MPEGGHAALLRLTRRLRLTMLPHDQLIAASVTISSPAGVAELPSARNAISTMPLAATAVAAYWNALGRSPVSSIDRPTVKNT